MEYIVGVALAVAVTAFARLTRFDRDRAFYPTVLVVVASYYVLFAVMSSSTHALVVESAVMAGFAVIAGIGFRFNLWFVVVALAAHGLFDLVHARWVTNPGVPTWWPGFCLSYDVVAAACMAWVLKRSTYSRDASTRHPVA